MLEENTLLIDVQDVVLTFKNEVLLNHISYQCEKGKIHGIIGRNGSGKTLLMKCICGFIRPTAGRILVQGKEVGKEMDFIENTGIIIEAPGFIPYYSGFKNLKILAAINNRIKDSDICNAMEQVGLEPRSKKRVGQYSLGMRQRLGIAQALMENPDIIILDEPFNGLDKQGVSEIRDYLLTLKDSGKTIIMSSHNSEDIEYLCDTVMEMDYGKILRG